MDEELELNDSGTRPPSEETGAPKRGRRTTAEPPPPEPAEPVSPRYRYVGQAPITLDGVGLVEPGDTVPALPGLVDRSDFVAE